MILANRFIRTNFICPIIFYLSRTIINKINFNNCLYLKIHTFVIHSVNRAIRFGIAIAGASICCCCCGCSVCWGFLGGIKQRYRIPFFEVMKTSRESFNNKE